MIDKCLPMGARVRLTYYFDHEDYLRYGTICAALVNHPTLGVTYMVRLDPPLFRWKPDLPPVGPYLWLIRDEVEALDDR